MHRKKLMQASRCLLFVAAALAAGCYDTALPQTLRVALPDDSSREALIHSGPPQLANSTWALYKAKNAGKALADEVPPLIRIEFGPNGEVVRAFDNTEFGTEYIGDGILPDGGIHAALIPGSSYVGQSYGAGVGANLGFTAMGKFFLGPIEAVVVSLTASGTLNETADRFEGTVHYHLDLNPDFAKLLDDLVGHEDEVRLIVAFKEK